MHALARGCCRLLAGVALASLAAPWPRQAIGEEIGAEQPDLTAAQREALIAYRAARAHFERQHRAYWNRVAAKRDARRAKRIMGLAYTADDFVADFPPRYTGPELPADVARLLAPVAPVAAARPLPTVADWLAQAKAQFAFVPAAITELEFKRRYAREALAVGLTKDQVVRIYALETGGQGTYDTQAGINPVTRQGHPISSALGYAQLLQSNSASELVKHGDGFVKRLVAMAAAPGISREAAEALRAKAAALRRMLRAVRSVPDDWNHYVRFAATPAGLAIHALNLDADVGPWLQVRKLRGLMDAAFNAGHAPLSGAEIELLNQAGPRTGLEMMQPVAQDMPTSNFFSESGYYRNSIVRDKTARELLKALSDRMEVNVKKPGAVEFARVFDELAHK
jgi:hypothetical protein